jgi:hypothetical protein
MVRFLFACLLIGSYCQSALAVDPSASSEAARYVAQVKYLRIEDGKQIIAIETEVKGTKGTPLNSVLSSKDGLVLNLYLRNVSDTPSQYWVHFRLVETKNGKKSLLSDPDLVTTVGHPAKMRVGDDNSRTEVELAVREIVGRWK